MVLWLNVLELYNSKVSYKRTSDIHHTVAVHSKRNLIVWLGEIAQNLVPGFNALAGEAFLGEAAALEP